MIYENEYKNIAAPSFHVNGFRSNPSFIRQKKTICIWSISFYPFGLFAFVLQSMAILQDKIINLQELSFNLVQKFKYINDNNNEKTVTAIEQILIEEFVISQDYIKKAYLISEFLKSSNYLTIKSFCIKQNINIKTFVKSLDPKSVNIKTFSQIKIWR